MAVHMPRDARDQKPRILVAEDNEINQKVVQRILKIAGCRMDLVDNGLQAVELVDRIQYDLILMDIQMPVMDGYEAAKRIRKADGGMRNKNENNPDSNSAFPIPPSELKPVPIVIMTGNAVAAESETCRKLGINDCIAKPLSPDRLLAMIKKWTASVPGSPAAAVHRSAPGHTQAAASPAARPVDLERALREFMGQKEVLDGLLLEFAAKVKSQIKTIRQAVRRRDYRVVAREAHSIKGAAANLTADQMAAVAADLEAAAELQQAGPVEHLADSLDETLGQFETYLAAQDPVESRHPVNH